jgi:hypothetical protein
MSGPSFKATGTIRELVATAERMGTNMDSNDADYAESYAELRANLAELLRQQGGDTSSREAAVIFKDTIPRLKKLLQPDHLDLIKAKANYAHLLGSFQRDHQEAQKLREEVVQSEIRTLGPMHPDTITSMCNLAMTLKRLGQSNKAARIYEEVRSCSTFWLWGA